MVIAVQPLGGDGYSVRVGDQTTHTVTATSEVLRRIAAPQERPGDTIVRAFRFLLEREPPESILESFDLEVVGRYFPEFWVEMAAR